MLSIACRELDRQFQLCSEDLDLIASKLESEFEANDSFSRNPAKLLQRVRALEEDLPKVQEDWKRVMVAKQTLIDIARAQQLANNRSLKQISSAADMKVNDDSEIFATFLKLEADWDKENESQTNHLREALNGHKLLTPEELNVEVLHSAMVDLRCPTASDEDSNVQSGVSAGAGINTTNASSLSEQQASAGTSSALCAPNSATTASSTPQHRISEAEFLSVSNIVRGRCRLDECNELLDIIVTHYRRTATTTGTGSGKAAGGGAGGGNSQAAAGPLSTSELVKLGARVTGQTGGSRLATLRCLKRICITKDGVTLNPKWLPR